MRTTTIFKLANSVRVRVKASATDRVVISFEEPGHDVALILTKQKAGTLKDALALMELI